jgi:hypothetical protein
MNAAIPEFLTGKTYELNIRIIHFQTIMYLMALKMGFIQKKINRILNMFALKLNGVDKRL